MLQRLKPSKVVMPKCNGGELFEFLANETEARFDTREEAGAFLGPATATGWHAMG